tara:strand:- start:563 stop:1093 length:531 start_codon:yes stop_codon:yes gene_type:complete
MRKIDELNKLRPKLNVEKTIRQILQILKRPDKVYGHSLVSIGEIEKLTKRVEKLENEILDIKDHLGLLSNMDKLNMLSNDEGMKKDEFTGRGMETNWSVYMLECKDKSIYTGICKGDIHKRMKEHASGNGSKYVRSRLPFELKWNKSGFTVSEAMKEEYRIKQLSHNDKRSIWEKK